MVNNKPLLIIECERLSRTDRELFTAVGDMAAMFQRALRSTECSTVVVDASGGDALPPIGSVAGVIVSGAAAMAADADPWIRRLGDWLEEACAAELPVLGVCFGHQLLGLRLGGTVAPNPHGPEYGIVPITLGAAAADDLLLAGLPHRLTVSSAHYQNVSTLPPGAVELARGASGMQAIRYRSRCWGVQFHPEFDRETTARLCEIIEQRASASGHHVVTSKDTGPDRHAADVIRRFVEILHPAGRPVEEAV